MPAAASALANAGGDGQLSERARHACLAVPVGDAKTAVELACGAAHEAEHAYAYDEAAAHYARALAAARSLDPPDSRASLDLTVRLAGARHRAGDPQDCRCCSTPPSERAATATQRAGTSVDVPVAPRSHEPVRTS